MKSIAFALLACFVGGALGLAAPAPKTAKVLFLVGGLYHNYDQLPKTLAANLTSRLKGDVTLDFTITKDLASLSAQDLSKYDLLMLNLCQQTELTSEEKEGFLTAVRGGLPLIALHCTFWCFQSWPEFKQVLGGFVPGHQKFGAFCVKTAKTGSPILKGVEGQFDVTDEPYLVNERDPSMDVLVKTCEALPGRPDPEPEVWTKTYFKGRVFAMTFGHDGPAQQNPNYLKLLGNGILWTLDRTK